MQYVETETPTAQTHVGRELPAIPRGFGRWAPVNPTGDGGQLRIATFWSAAVEIATPRSRVSNAFAASLCSAFLHSFLASRIACFGKSLGDFIADAEEFLS
jgi:hypothetical protein